MEQTTNLAACNDIALELAQAHAKALGCADRLFQDIKVQLGASRTGPPGAGVPQPGLLEQQDDIMLDSDLDADPSLGENEVAVAQEARLAYEKAVELHKVKNREALEAKREAEHFRLSAVLAAGNKRKLVSQCDKLQPGVAVGARDAALSQVAALQAQIQASPHDAGLLSMLASA